MKHPNSNDAAAASKAITNRTKEVIDTFDLDTDLSGTPTAAFSRVLAELDDKQRAALIEVARRAYKAGARRGAITALDAVMDGHIDVESNGNEVVLSMKGRLRVAARTLIISKSDRGEDLEVPVAKFSMSSEKLGF